MLPVGKPEQVGHVGQLIVGQRAEMNPAEDQRKGDGHGQQAAPEEALMHPPAQPRALGDETSAPPDA